MHICQGCLILPHHAMFSSETGAGSLTLADSLVKPEWERGQSRASEQVRGLGRPLLQALPAARNLRPPQSPGGWVLVQGQQVGDGRIERLQRQHLILSGCEKPPIVSSSSRCYIVVNVRVPPISNT